MSHRKIDLQLRSNSLLNWFLQPKSICIDGEKQFVKSLISNSISSSYRCIDSNDIETEREVYRIHEIDRSIYDTEYLRPVIKISDLVKKHLSEYIDQFILHGSLSTFDFIKGWSDFDSIVVIKNKAMCDPSAMMRIRSVFFEIDRIIKKIDTHQHHGVHFITETDLQIYPNLYLPSNLFKDSVSLIKSSELVINRRDSKKEEINRFNSIYETLKGGYSGGMLRHHEYNGEYLMGSFRNYKNAMYQLKYFLSVVVILPSYFMNILGEYPGKGDSIEKCRAIMKNNGFDIIDKATQIRSTWTNYPVLDNIIPDEVMHILDKNYLFDGYNLIKQMKKYLEI
jgi:hypothetical protein